MNLEYPRQLTQISTALLQSILEGLIDGVLILTRNGEWICSNSSAHHICQQLNQGKPQKNSVPQTIWTICQTFMENHTLYCDRLPTIESEIPLSKSRLFRVRVHWLELDSAQQPYLLVTLEDCCQTSKWRAIAEAQKYGLTPKQTEVWLLRRIGYSYREIAAELWIAVDTVKKHLKDIYAKQKEALDY